MGNYRKEIFTTTSSKPDMEKTARHFYGQFSRREREIMDAVYNLEEASAADVARHLRDEDGYDSIRVILGILEKKGYLQHRREGKRHIYLPTVSREKATQSALSHVMKTFFQGSPSSAILALLDMSSSNLSQDELEEIASKIEDASREKV
jgi:predicted transcriptional regulator